MTYQVLARKWRPKQFEQVIGQDHITRTLKNAILKNKVAHAYLFTGTRGVGKTTIARIFAKALMCQNKADQYNPCLECESCKSIDNSTSIDYTEIDGASNNSVENIRDLIDGVQYLPTKGQYKVYVIDEVHMLSTSAFNALLKTLEEPPAHVVFVFATTDPQKLLGTVLSRCQRFDFKSVTVEILQAHLENIAHQENFNFENKKVLKEICKQGNGSVRDTLSLLDQVLSLSADDVVTEESLTLSLGLADTKHISLLLNGILSGDKNLSIQSYKNIIQENVDFKKFVGQILESIFEVIEGIDDNNTISGNFKITQAILEQVSLAEILWIYESMSKDFDWALTSFNPERNVELAILKVSLRRQIFGEEKVKLKFEESKKKVKSFENSDVSEAQVFEQTVSSLEEETDVAIEGDNSEQQEVHAAQKDKEEETSIEEKSWESFLDYLFREHKTLAVNTERGNLLDELNLQDDELIFNLGFTEENHIFYDFMLEARADLKEKVAMYFNKNIENVNVRVNVLSLEEKESKNFKSKVELDEHHEALKKDEKKQKLLDNKFIKEAEDLFSSQVSKIILNEDN